MNEEKGTAENKTASAVENNDAGNKPKTESEFERLNAETERLNKAIAENENAKARAKLGGISTFEQPLPKKELTPREYARMIEKGIIPEM